MTIHCRRAILSLVNSSFDSWKCAAPDDSNDLPEPCPVCTGDEHADPCSEDCADLVRRVKAERIVRRLYKAARRSLSLARLYQAQIYPETRDIRIDCCLQRVDELRGDIATWRRHARGVST